MNADREELAGRLEREMREGLDGVTLGPWQVVVDERPWLLPAKPESDRPDETRGHHIEYRIFTVRNHPQLKAPWPIVNSSTGLGEEPGKPVYMVHMDRAVAEHLSRCSPENILTLLDTISSLRSQIERVEKERDEAREGWQPIETAPKDGTCVILYGRPEVYEGKQYPARVTAGAWAAWDETDDVAGGATWSSWDGGFREDGPPTHWRPLPTPPIAQKAQDNG